MHEQAVERGEQLVQKRGLQAERVADRVQQRVRVVGEPREHGARVFAEPARVLGAARLAEARAQLLLAEPA